MRCLSPGRIVVSPPAAGPCVPPAASPPAAGPHADHRTHSVPPLPLSLSVEGPPGRGGPSTDGEVPLNDSPVLLPAGSSLHYQGTTRIGPVDDGTSVCDSHSRVWSTRGLWVAGNNVLPTATAFSPTLTSAALAVRGARALLDHLNTTAERSTPTARADVANV
ncbi:hypothetical protein B6E66_38750 [Streptomyces maremycinicus]|nr:hypothetical protein B6E66_38750 [Streptomyces sp. B9173]